MSETFVNTSPMYTSSISLSTDNLTTEPSNFNTTVETPVFEPRPPIILYIAWFIAVVIGNCIAVAILIRNRRGKQWSTFNRLVFMVAVTDFTGQVFTIPIIFASYSSRDILVTGGVLCDFISVTTIMTSLMSALLVCLMSIDRFIAIWFPIFYRNRITIKHMWIAVAFVIATGLLVGILPTVGVNTYKLQKEGTWCFFDLEPKEPGDRVVLYICASIGVVAVLLMLIMNGLVVYGLYNLYIRKGNQPAPNYSSSQPAPNYSLVVKNVQNICFLIVIMVAFIVTWMPFIVISFINAVGLSDFDYELTKSCLKFTIGHQVLNPWIYIIMRDCLFSRCLKYARKHSKQGSFLHRISENSDTN